MSFAELKKNFLKRNKKGNSKHWNYRANETCVPSTINIVIKIVICMIMKFIMNLIFESMK